VVRPARRAAAGVPAMTMTGTPEVPRWQRSNVVAVVAIGLVAFGRIVLGS
jgi:hypothetical protein